MEATESSEIYSYVNEAVLTSMVLVFALWRTSRSTLPTYNLFRGKLRSCGTLFAFVSVLCSALYSGLLAFLSTRLPINKSEVELVGRLDETYRIGYREIDLVGILNVALVLSGVMRMSAVYLLVGLWGPCAYSAFNNSIAFDLFKTGVTNIFITKSVFNTSIITFAKIYAFLRTPALIYFFFSLKDYSDRRTLFFESFFLGSEVYLAVALLIILRTKHSFLSEQKTLDSTYLLNLCLIGHGFLTYTLNTIAVPFEVSAVQGQILKSFGLALRLALDILLIAMFCPIKSQLFDHIPDKAKESYEITKISQMNNPEPIVHHIEDIIEFDGREEAK
jgi:hypothetical protein